MYYPPKQAEFCGGMPCISGHKAKGPDEGQPAIGAIRGAISFSRSHGDCKWPFQLSILKMSINTTEGKSLICTCTRILDVIIGESTIVAMVVKNLHTMLFGEVLEGSLGVNCFLQSEMSHQMNIL
jgi:hypothetical protein